MHRPLGRERLPKDDAWHHPAECLSPDGIASEALDRKVLAGGAIEHRTEFHNLIRSEKNEMNVSTNLKRIFGAACFAVATCGFVGATARAEDRIPGFTYIEQKGQNASELKRVTSNNAKGVLVAKAVYYTDGRIFREVFRPDGTLKFSHAVYGNGQQSEHINYDGTGKTVTDRKAWFFDGTLDWEATRKPDGNTLRKDYRADGTLRQVRELFEKNGFLETAYRKDGTKWYGSERKPGETGPGTKMYFAADGKTLKRTHQGTVMTVVVLDKAGKELYTQSWVSGVARYSLLSVSEPTANGGHRVISMLGKNVKEVKYFKADGTLERTENGNALSTPVDASRLGELALDDPTVPVIHQTR